MGRQPFDESAHSRDPAGRFAVHVGSEQVGELPDDLGTEFDAVLDDEWKRYEDSTKYATPTDVAAPMTWTSLTADMKREDALRLYEESGGSAGKAARIRLYQERPDLFDRDPSAPRRNSSGLDDEPTETARELDASSPWDSLADRVGPDATNRLFSASGGLIGPAHRIQRAYEKATVETSESGERTLLLSPDESGLAPMRVRLVISGDRHGRNDVLTWGEDGWSTDPTVEFYDARYPEMADWSGRGQFVTRYSLDDLEQRGWSDSDLNLGSGSRSWSVTPENLGAVTVWAREEVDLRADSSSFYPADADEIEPPF